MNATLRQFFQRYLGKQPPPQAPFSLSPETVAGLKRLVESRDWPCYLALLEGAWAEALVGLSKGLDHDQYLYQSGYVAALRHVGRLPDQVLHYLAAKESSREQRDLSADLDASRYFLNTDWWRSYERERAQGRAGTVYRDRIGVEQGS